MSRAAPSRFAPRRRGASRRAFSLVELAVSMAIVAIVCGAIFSVVTLMIRAATAEAETAPAGQTAATGSALNQIAGELKTAASITERTATSITFTVPDRNADGSPETIRYAWGGTGTALTRQYNSAAPITVLAGAQNFALSYVDRTVGPPPPSTSSEQLLYAYDDPASTTQFATKNTTWSAQYFRPTLPGGTLSWSITRVKIMGQRNNANIIYSVEVRAIDAANKPTGSALASVAFNSNSLNTTSTWLDLTFSTPASSLDPAAGYAIIVRGTSSSSNAVDAMYNKTAVSSVSRGWMSTTNSGSSWGTPSATKSMQLYVYGTVTTP